MVRAHCTERSEQNAQTVKRIAWCSTPGSSLYVLIPLLLSASKLAVNQVLSKSQARRWQKVWNLSKTCQICFCGGAMTNLFWLQTRSPTSLRLSPLKTLQQLHLRQDRSNGIWALSGKQLRSLVWNDREERNVMWEVYSKSLGPVGSRSTPPFWRQQQLSILKTRVDQHNEFFYEYKNAHKTNLKLIYTVDIGQLHWITVQYS